MSLYMDAGQRGIHTSYRQRHRGYHGPKWLVMAAENLIAGIKGERLPTA
jgi:hypothetical protein